MYVIIVGTGAIGTPLVGLATEAGHEVVAVERDATKANAIAQQYDCLVLNADATARETLLDAGADRADAVISTTDEDATNVMVCLLAQEFDVPQVVSVVHTPDHMSVFRQIGVHTMQNPQRLIAEYLYRSVERPSVVDFMHIGEKAEVFEVVVDAGAPIADRTIAEVAERGLLDDDDLVVAVERDDADGPVTPKGRTVIRAGDLLTVYSATGVTEPVLDVFTK